MNNFKSYHPISNFIYFFTVILFSMLFWNPFLIGVSLFCGFLYFLKLKGIGSLVKNLFFIIPFALFCTLLTPVFNHEGATVLLYFPNGNPLTKEAVICGIASGGMLVSVLWWFSCFNEIMNSGKFVYLFSKLSPSLSLVFSLVMGFVPKFLNRFKKISEAKKSFSAKKELNGIKEKTRFYSGALSALTVWSLENSMQTAENMRSRGYGIKNTQKRTSFTPHEFKKRDMFFVIYFVFWAIYFSIGVLWGKTDFEFYPIVSYSDFDFYTISVFFAYFLMCTAPFVCERRLKR